LTRREIVDRAAKRRWTEAYLALTHAKVNEPDRIGDWRGDADHPMVNWVSAQSAPPLLPPYPAGAARSRFTELLDSGHEGVVLAPAEREKIAAWIDLGVPFCGDYGEAHAWTDAELAKYEHFLAKRLRWQAVDAQNIADWLREPANAR
jgi:hypothetical protein